MTKTLSPSEQDTKPSPHRLAEFCNKKSCFAKSSKKKKNEGKVRKNPGRNYAHLNCVPPRARRARATAICTLASAG